MSSLLLILLICCVKLPLHMAISCTLQLFLMCWGLVTLYSRYHIIILLPQSWWRLVILLSCYRIILPSLTTSSYRLRTGCHCSILSSLVNIALESMYYVSKEKLWIVAPCFCRLSLLSCPFLLHPTRKSILSQNALMATPDILGIKSGSAKMQRNLNKTKVPVF